MFQPHFIVASRRFFRLRFCVCLCLCHVVFVTFGWGSLLSTRHPPQHVPNVLSEKVCIQSVLFALVELGQCLHPAFIPSATSLPHFSTKFYPPLSYLLHTIPFRATLCTEDLPRWGDFVDTAKK